MFSNRIDAGRQLAELVVRRGVVQRNDDPDRDTVVAGLPRGGVPVAAEVARALGAPLDVIIVRKLGVPGRSELAMGAIGEGGVRVLNERTAEMFAITPERVAQVEQRERAELQRRAERFRLGHEHIDLAGREVLIVDDGIATGATARAACAVARKLGARRVILATPVAPRGWEGEMGTVADDYVAIDTPFDFGAVGRFYEDFDQTTDDEVVRLLDLSRRRSSGGSDGRTPPPPR